VSEASRQVYKRLRPCVHAVESYTTFKPCGKKASRGTLTWTSGKGHSAKTAFSSHKTWISRTRESLCPGRTTGSCSYACARRMLECGQDTLALIKLVERLQVAST